jgi:hypothetical protein
MSITLEHLHHNVNTGNYLAKSTLQFLIKFNKKLFQRLDDFLFSIILF